MRVSFLVASILIFFSAPRMLGAQEYAANLIPDSLTTNADYVKRYEELRVEVVSSSKVKLYRKYAFTILNERGVGYGVLYDYYDKFRSIESIEGTLYDASGKKIKSVKKKEIADLSGTDGSEFATDDRYKKHDFYFREYPYTVVYEVESETSGVLSLPTWMPQRRDRVSVEQSKLVVKFPYNNPVRYYLINFIEPSVTSNSGDKTLTWEVKNIKAVIPEEYQPSWYKILPSVKLGPSYFEAQGHSGDMSSWESYGKYIYALLQGRDELPQNVKQDVHAMTDKLSSTSDKVAVLYKYLQDNTRYISIQMGIGGWQPFEAKYVAEKKYGDCKALSNYMVALLKEAGVYANYVEIQSGEDAEPLIESFPASQANHVIACVPNGKDSIWLECTSSFDSPGYNGSFTGNRKAILIKEDGAHIVNTHHYTPSENLQVRNVVAKIDASGKLTASVNTKLTGVEQETASSLIHRASAEEREDYLNRALSIPSYKVNKHEYQEVRACIPVIYENLTVTSDNYANMSNKRLFVTPNIFNLMGAKFSTEKPRLYPIHYTSTFLNIDTVYIDVPEGYVLETQPKTVEINNSFGKYSIKTSFKNNQIEFIRSYERQEKIYPSSEWKSFVTFMEEVYKNDRSRVILVKNVQ